MSALRRDQTLPPIRDLSRQALIQTRLTKAAFGGAVMGEMKRAIAREQAAWSQNMQDEKRMKSTLVIAAAIIAAGVVPARPAAINAAVIRSRLCMTM